MAVEEDQRPADEGNEARDTAPPEHAYRQDVVRDPNPAAEPRKIDEKVYLKESTFKDIPCTVMAIDSTGTRYQLKMLDDKPYKDGEWITGDRLHDRSLYKCPGSEPSPLLCRAPYCNLPSQQSPCHPGYISMTSSPSSPQHVPDESRPARCLTGETAVDAESLGSPLNEKRDALPSDQRKTCDEKGLSSITVHGQALSRLVSLLRNGRDWFKRCNSGGLPSRLELPSPIVRSLNKPKTGYPNLATFIDSSDAFMVFRRFGYLRARVLLDRQEELRLLEEELEMFDSNHPHQLTSRPGTLQALGPRRAILDKIETVLERYTSLLASAQQLVSFHRPVGSEYRAVCTYLDNNKPIHRSERVYIRHRDDLVTLRPGREHAWLDRSIEYALRKLHKPFPFLKRVFSDEMTRLKTQDRQYEIYFSHERINVLANVLIMWMILALLIVPIYLLYLQVSTRSDNLNNHDMAICLGILLVFTLAFSAVLSLFTRAKRHEILGAAAAYCAVLVVFFGNINTSS